MKKILTNSVALIFILMSVVACSHPAGASNEYYEPSGAPAAGSSLSSSVLRDEFVSIGSMAVKLPPLAGNGGKPVFVNSGGTALESKSVADANTALGTELTSRKDATGGYAGLTLFKINFKNALNTVTSFFTNANTAQRTYTFQDRDGTIADNTDLAAKADSSALTSGLALKADSSTVASGLALKADIASPTFTGVPSTPTAANGTDSTQIASTEFVQNAVASVTGGIGVGQAWQDVTSSRAESTIYQNDTGKPIQVSISIYGTYPNTGTFSLLAGSASPPTVTVADHALDNSNHIKTAYMNAIIPPGHYYRVTDVTASAYIRRWSELR